MPTDARQGPVLATYALKTLHARKIVVVDDATLYGRGLANEFAKAVVAGGGHIAGHEATNDKARDFKAILNKIKRVQPDVVMFGGMDVTGGPFAKQAAALGIKAKILGGDGMCTAEMRRRSRATRRRTWCARKLGVDAVEDWTRARISRRSTKRVSTCRCRSTRRSPMTLCT